MHLEMRGNPTWVARAYLDEWTKLPSMKRLSEDLRRENMKASTFRTYMKNVKAVINFAGYEDPEKFLADFRNDNIVFDELCDKYIEANAHLQNTLVRKRVLRTKRWLRSNIDLKNGEGAKLNLDTITLPKGNQKRGASDSAPTRLDLKELLAHMKNTRDKAITLTAASSGLRPETLFSLNVGDVEFSFDVRRGLKTERVEDIAKINVPIGKDKVNFKHYSFITPEAKAMLEHYLDERRRIGGKINDESPLWVTHFDLLPEGNNKRPLKKLSYDAASHQWRRILKRARKDKISYAEGNSWFWYKFHFKTLRKFFRTEATNARCIEDLKYFWMGQPGGVHRPEYYKERLEVAVDEYRRLIPYLSVQKAPVAVEQEDLEKRDEEIQNMREKVNSQSELLHQLRGQLEEYQGTFDLVTKEFLTMLIVLGERIGDKALLGMMQETKERLEKGKLTK